MMELRALLDKPYVDILAIKSSFDMLSKAFDRSIAV